MKSVSLIILAYITNKELYDLTEATFKSLEKSEGYETIKEIIVVDNGSTMGQKLLERHADIVIRNKKNLGYPAAVNQGVKRATGELLAIANNDIRVSPNWLRAARVFFAVAPKDVGSLHYRMIHYDEPIKLGDKTWITGRERWCGGSFFVIKRSVFKKVGFYDEGYGLGGFDDWDFHHRMRHICKYKTAFTIKACFQHKHSSTYLVMDDGTSREVRDESNRQRFKKKFGASAEDIWVAMYPDQMSEGYWEFLEECV